MLYLPIFIFIINYSICVTQYQSNTHHNIFLNHRKPFPSPNNSCIILGIDLKHPYSSYLATFPYSNTNVQQNKAVNSYIDHLKHSLLYLRPKLFKTSSFTNQTRLHRLDAKGGRTLVTLECSESKKLGTRASRYVTTKNKLNTPGRLQLMKYNRYARKHTLHKEIK